jgi:hypothetical protein
LDEKMKHEFKVTKSKEQTVYTLESATGGSSSTSGNASVSTALGGVQRRPTDSIFAQEAKKEEPKPRNFVAKNAKMGGAGKMKDKSKTIPRHEKHKKPVAEEWSQKYKSSINCSHPKGFSQKAHCAGKQKHNESMMTMEATCPDCGMCQTHGSLNEIKKGQKDSNGFTKCWPGKHADGTKKSATTGKQVRNCVPNEGVAEEEDKIDSRFKKTEWMPLLDAIKILKHYGATPEKYMGHDMFPYYDREGNRKYLDDISWNADNSKNVRVSLVNAAVRELKTQQQDVAEDHEIQMASSELQSIAKNAVHLLDLVRKYSEEQGLDAWQQSKITKAADYLNSVLQSVSGEQNSMEETRNNYHANTTGFGRRPRDDERHDLDTQVDPKETMMYNLTINGKPLNPEPIIGRSNLIKFGKQQAASGVDLSNAVISPVGNLEERTEVKDKSGKIVSWKDDTDWRKSEKNKTGQPKDPRGKVTNLSDKARRETEKNVEEDAYMMELAGKIAEKLNPSDPTDVWVQDFQKADPKKYHQFKNKTPQKKAQMAVAAHYAANEPSKKN